jgi:nicotinamide-nucleotide amidase
MESLEEKIIRIANSKKLRLGFAESATGGLCSHRLTAIPGSSQSFMGSVVCYDESIKESILGVRWETLKKFAAVSPQTAQEMAEGLLKKFKLDIAVSITGYAGPGGGTAEYPVGTVFIGMAVNGKKTKVELLSLKGDRDILKQRFSQAALYALLDELETIA